MSINYEDVVFVDNPEPRVPCVLLLDTSSSMSGEKIHELNAGLKVFKDALMQDETAMLRAEIAIISFGPVEVKQDFISAKDFVPPVCEAGGFTPMGEAVLRALDLIEQRKQIYKKNGISYYRPWVFLITDGEPTDTEETWRQAVQRVHDAEGRKKVAFFAVGVAGANMARLSELSVREPVRLKGLNFEGMFLWLSASLSTVSHSNPGDTVPLQSPAGWGEV